MERLSVYLEIRIDFQYSTELSIQLQELYQGEYEKYWIFV